MIIFIIYIMVLSFFGVAMTLSMHLWERKNIINLFGIFFLIMAPLTPLIAKLLGII